MRERKVWISVIVLLSLTVILLVGVLVSNWMRYSPWNRRMDAGQNGGMMGNSGMMGSGGMMGNATAANTATIDNNQLHQLVAEGEQGARIDRAKKTITYTGGSVNLVALASPHGVPNMTWEIDGLVNPTLFIQPGATVHVTLVNPDWGYMHGFEVTKTAPPYSQMPMMTVDHIFMLPPLPQRTTQALTNARYHVIEGEMTLHPGTYYYICPVPGHAKSGMYGVVKVS
ncbi:hypothetical protein LLE49_07505 [Alicyclobacillus tolerans]|uniref:sulfocyanin-like copper-binding protein n=1 Tax=Alicyclobacillus tolerans TaxID=90970 RepID=UPI001F46AF79|nr:sulfocyanin-like copper-binding protein [Alicyclobacillus tolerans]MCF8564590.1 hypothetical protein [Alicyclobacillus tolerans]